MIKRAPLKIRLKQYSRYPLGLIGVAVVVLLAINLIGTRHPAAQGQLDDRYTKSLTMKWLAQCYTQDCVNQGMENITKNAGPEAALASLHYYVDNVPNYLPGDNHLRAHHVGYQLFRSYGLSTKVFLECGSDFNNGCMHGYIEEAETHIKGSSASTLADELCKPILAGSAYSYNQKHFCYHGIGHAIMEDVNYDLTAALNQCDAFGNQIAQIGCWQGAFMENEWGYVSHIIDNGTFSKTDPMAPCDNVAEKYVTQCYMNQEGYLFYRYDNDFQKSAQACVAAGDNAGVCVESLGLAATAESWQPLLLKGQNAGSLESNAWLLCQEAPKAYASNCVIGAVFNILALDGLDFKRSSIFCGLVGSSFQRDCFSSIGQYAWVQTPAPNPPKVESYCLQLPADWQAACREGAKQHY